MDAPDCRQPAGHCAPAGCRPGPAPAVRPMLGPELRSGCLPRLPRCGPPGRSRHHGAGRAARHRRRAQRAGARPLPARPRRTAAAPRRPADGCGLARAARCHGRGSYPGGGALVVGASAAGWRWSGRRRRGHEPGYAALCHPDTGGRLRRRPGAARGVQTSTAPGDRSAGPRPHHRMASGPGRPLHCGVGRAGDGPRAGAGVGARRRGAHDRVRSEPLGSADTRGAHRRPRRPQRRVDRGAAAGGPGRARV